MLPIVEHQVQDEQPQTTQQPHPTASTASAPSPLPPPTAASSVAASHGGRRKQAKPQKKNGRSSIHYSKCLIIAIITSLNRYVGR